MKKLVRLFTFALLLLSTALLATAQAPVKVAHVKPMLSLEVLSDTGGANLNPYLNRLTAGLKAHLNTIEPAPDEQLTAGPRQADFTISIAPDGRLSAMNLEESTRDIPFMKAVWTALRDTSYPPLPARLKDVPLKLRIHLLAS